MFENSRNLVENILHVGFVGVDVRPGSIWNTYICKNSLKTIVYKYYILKLAFKKGLALKSCNITKKRKLLRKIKDKGFSSHTIQYELINIFLKYHST